MSANRTAPRVNKYFEDGATASLAPGLDDFWGIGDIRCDELIPDCPLGMSEKRIIKFLHFSATGFVWVYGDDAVLYVRPDKIVKKSECGTLKEGKLPSLF